MTELEPFCVFFDGGQPPVAMWQPAITNLPAVALFSTQSKAQAYASQRGDEPFNRRVVQLSELELVRLLAELFSQGVTHAALDPDGGPQGGTARSLFDLRLVLKAARQRLSATQMEQRTAPGGG